MLIILMAGRDPPSAAGMSATQPTGVAVIAPNTIKVAEPPRTVASFFLFARTRLPHCLHVNAIAKPPVVLRKAGVRPSGRTRRTSIDRSLDQPVKAEQQ